MMNFLIEAIFALAALLGVLLLFLFIEKKKRKSLESQKIEKSPQNDLQVHLEKIKNQNTSTEELQLVVKSVVEDFGIIKDDNFNLYAQMLLEIARHANTSTKIILVLDRGLSKQNPAYKKKISDFTSQGLNSRKV